MTTDIDKMVPAGPEVSHAKSPDAVEALYLTKNERRNDVTVPQLDVLCWAKTAIANYTIAASFLTHRQPLS